MRSARHRLQRPLPRLRYLAEARFDDELDVATAVTHLGTTAMTLGCHITRVCGASPVAEIETRYVWVEVDGHAKTSAPDWARAALAPHTQIGSQA